MGKFQCLYLAHPIMVREEIRAWELAFEKHSGIALRNPFYDGAERDDIKKIDSGQMMGAFDLDYEKIVRGDVGAIVAADGLVAYVKKTVPSIGTFMEIWICMSLGKPVFVVSPDWGEHPWLRYCTIKSGGETFKSFEEFQKFMEAT